MHSPLEQFMIKKIIPLEIAGVDVSFTNSSLFMVLAILLVISVQHFGTRKAAVIPGRAQSFVEIAYEFVADMLKENAGKEGLRYFPFVFTVFMFVLTGNLLGVVPYSFTFTSHIIVTFALALVIFLIVTAIGFMRHGLHFLRLFFPEGTPIFLAPLLVPIEILAYLMRPVSLSVRLFANMLAGHVMLKLFAGFTIAAGVYFGWGPIAINIMFSGFEIFVAVIQAYIFTVMTCLYLNDAINLH